jgi:multidrug efflux system membrane fusion protein
VQKDQLLFSIDPRPYEATLAQADAALAQDQSKLQLAADQLKRSKELVDGNFISRQDIDNLQTTVNTTQAQIAADQAQIANAKLNLEYCSIVSPIAGRLGKRLVDAGNIVTANSGSALVVVQQVDVLYVDFTVAETDLPTVRDYFAKGKLRIEVGLTEDPSFHRSGELHFVDSTVSSGAGTVQLRGTVRNEDLQLWPGQFVTVRLVLDTLKDALLVPAQALQISQQGPFIFVVKADSTVELRPVKAGQRQGDRMVIASGLQPGETVVVAGQLALAPGGKIVVVDPNAPKAAPAQAPAADSPKDSQKKAPAA